MNLTSVTICGFRCFGAEPTTISISPLTALIGANGTGKTAVLLSLVRMFGTTRSQRTLTFEDFHLPVGVEPPTELSLWIEARFEFPELLSDDDAHSSLAIPECLRHILIEPDGEVPFCRMRMHATWRKTNTAEGDVEQRLCWIDSAEDNPPPEAEQHLSVVERSLIRVFYVPATRDAVRELRAVAGTILTSLLARVPWSDEVRRLIKTHSDALDTAIHGESALQALEKTLQEMWQSLKGAGPSPTFTLGEADLATVLRRLETRIGDDQQPSRPVAVLSEGELSLLYMSLVEATLSFSGATPTDASVGTGTTEPVLTVLALEEPENHLAPQYLGRILRTLRTLIKSSSCQVILASHSPSIMRRIEPAEVRHLRTKSDGSRAAVGLTLPDDADVAFRYVREAIRMHPELYFAKAVVLCEGASEEVVLPQAARACELDIDPQFITVVPLGGRHVHHFWRLLRELGTPFVTLLDLDTERQTGGGTRLHAIMQELLDFGELAGSVHPGLSELVGIQDLATPAEFDPWCNHLEKNFDIFFSRPLDFDLLMLEKFPSAYQESADGRPRIPREAEKLAARLASAARAVLGSEGGDGSTFSGEQRELFPWYSYLFIGSSKPSVHARAMARLDVEPLRTGAPDVILRLLERVRALAA